MNYRWMVLPVLLFLAACGLSSEIEGKAKRLSDAIAGLNTRLAAQEESYTALKANATEWEFFAPYAERENWEAAFGVAATDIAGLQRRYQTEIQPILDADREEDEVRLGELLTAFEGSLQPVADQVMFVEARMQTLRMGYENAPAWIAEARAGVATIEALVTAIGPVIAEAKTAFPNRVDAIDERGVPLRKLLSDANAQLVVAEQIFVLHEAAADADYAAFADAVAFIRNAATEVVAIEADYRSDLASLYEDYTRILRDMKIEYRVTIGRDSWDGASDWDNSPEYIYPPAAISATDYEYLTSLPATENQGGQGYLAAYYSSWGVWQTNVHITEAVWNRIGITPGAAWYSGDNEAMFWIEDIEPVYFHRYDDIKGSNVTENDWEEVDEAEYGLYADAFGMAIESKPLGAFEDEAIAEPVPVGIEMVGDARYGEWQQDASGNSFWHYYGQYAFINSLLGNDRYYQSDYDNYRRWRNERDGTAATYGWYGSNRATPTWGSSGTATLRNPSYATSLFGQAGGAQSVAPSVRNAGETIRNRGPGEGGK